MNIPEKYCKLIMIVLQSVMALSLCDASTALADLPWEMTHKFLAEDAIGGAWFGTSVDMSDNLAVIGAERDNNGINFGSAYIFDVTTGRQLTKLVAADSVNGDRFGHAVAISGNLAVVGAPFDDDNGSDSGSAYIFDVTTGQQLFKLLASDGTNFDFFGCSVAIDGNIVLIGAEGRDGHDGNETNSGTAYVFDVTSGMQIFEFFRNDERAFDSFGSSVALSGNFAVIGALGTDDNISNSGSAFIFDVTTGHQLKKLLASDGAQGDFFGTSVAIKGNLVVIGAPLHNDKGTNSGAIYVFDTTSGEQLFKLLADDGASEDQLGNSVSVSGNMAIAGAPSDQDNGRLSGSAYAFDLATGEQLFKILPADGNESDEFGNSVSICGDLMVVGAIFGDGDIPSSGSAYVFRKNIDKLAVLPDPLISGQDGTFFIIHTLPEERTWLLYSLDGLQQSFLRQLNVIIDLANPKLVLGPRRTDDKGDLQLILPLPDTQSPLPVWFQVVQQRNVTNFVASQLIP